MLSLMKMINENVYSELNNVEILTHMYSGSLYEINTSSNLQKYVCIALTNNSSLLLENFCTIGTTAE
jgi:hypothetical protein